MRPRRSWARRGSVATLCVVSPLCVSATASAAPVTHEVVGSGFSWDPSVVDASVGDTVAWDWSSGFHDLCMDDTAPVGPGDGPQCGDDEMLGTSPGVTSAERIFNTPGSYPFYCSIHYPSMSGTVQVAEAGPAEPSVSIDSAPAQIRARAFLRDGMRVRSSCDGVELGTLQLFAKGTAARKLGFRKTRRAVLAKAPVACG